jgi:excinuclease ABC subunit A
MRAADHIVDLGPGAGEHGGNIVFEGPLEKLLATATVADGALSARRVARLHAPRERRAGGSRSACCGFRARARTT